MRKYTRNPVKLFRLTRIRFRSIGGKLVKGTVEEMLNMLLDANRK